MKKYLVQFKNAVWCFATNIVSASALDAAVNYSHFRIFYLLIAVGVWPIYLIPWYRRLEKSKNRAADESPLQFYLRAYWRINAFGRNK